MSNGGMRRILKHPPSAVAWIRNKYNKGLYDRNDTSIPIAHEIFSLNPPLSSQVTYNPRIHKEEEEYRKIYLPTERAIQSYVQRHDLKKQAAQESGQHGQQDEALMEEERMAKLLGVDRKSALGNKSIVYNNAYKFAIRQLEVQRQNPGYTEEEAVQAVEDILKLEDKNERITSREITKDLTSEAKDLKKKTNFDPSSASKNTSTTTQTPHFDMDTIPSILHGDSQTILQLTIWGERLQQIPYERWTLGAATALDHWIATKILKLREETWEDILKGTEKTGLSRGRDIIAVRKALFPETVLEFSEEDAFAEKMNEEDTDKRIDDLLASLQFDENEDEDDDSDIDDKWVGDSFGDSIGEEEQFQSKLETLLETLQSWRQRNVQTKYETWDDVAKMEFDKFLTEYIQHLTPDTEMHMIDLESTRTSLLSEPPMTREASNSFFTKLVDETEAEIFLDQLRKSSEKNEVENTILEQFLALPYHEQLSRLVTIGTLRPFYDEYTTEKARLNFLKDNEEFLLRGVPLESLIEDKKGPILMDPALMNDAISEKSEKDEKMTRFRIDKVPFGTGNALREDAVLKAWTAYKSAKAIHEEKLFHDGKLGLEYEKKKSYKENQNNDK